MAGEQVDLPAVAPRAPQGLAVDRDRPSPLVLVGAVPVGQPRADRFGQGLGVQARGGSGGWWPRPARVAVRILPAGAQRGVDRLRGVLSPFGDRGHGPGAGEHRGGGQGEDGDDRVAAATVGSWVGDGGEVGQQVWGFGVLQGVGAVELDESGRDRG